jgi:hypothetical protein
MDEKELLTRLVTLQEEQNQLLKKHLTRIKFSLWTLLLLTTGICLLLGVNAYRQQTAPTPAGTFTWRATPAQPPLFPQPTNQTFEDLFGDPPPAFEPADEPPVVDAPAIK